MKLLKTTILICVFIMLATQTQLHSTKLIKKKFTFVKMSKAPILDGIVNKDEWAGSTLITFDKNRTVYLKHDGKTLYLAYKNFGGKSWGFACVFFYKGDKVYIFHASAQLGSAVYEKSNEFWNPQNKKYHWKKPDIMWKDEGWQATVSKNKGEQEFAISFKLLGVTEKNKKGTSFNVALGYICDSNEPGNDQRTFTWPENLMDDCNNTKLLGGWNPAKMKFNPTNWGHIRIK